MGSDACRLSQDVTESVECGPPDSTYCQHAAQRHTKQEKLLQSVTLPSQHWTLVSGVPLTGTNRAESRGWVKSQVMR